MSEAKPDTAGGRARPCTKCKHEYIEPCDGKNPDCKNRKPAK